MGPTAAAVFAANTVQFSYTGGTQHWTVPNGVTSAKFDVFGAQGGGDPSQFIKGGLGGESIATLPVHPGDDYQINVGGRGGDWFFNTTCCDADGNNNGFQHGPGAGGFNGGAPGGTSSKNIRDGAGGGGASDVSSSAFIRLITAGGGGGDYFHATECSDSLPSGRQLGGDGGGLTGVSGWGFGGGGGAQTAGGAGGPHGGGQSAQAGDPGSFNHGGAGADALPATDEQNVAGGGGGGGWYGGGGGGSAAACAGGGGGGSGNVPAGGTTKTGVHSGPGFVEITYTAEQPITATPQSISMTEGVSSSGTVATFTDPDGASTAGEYTATIDWGDGASSAGTVSGSTGGPFSVGGSHPYADEGSYVVKVVITDADNSSNTASATSTASVSDAYLTPGSPITSFSTEGAAFSGAVGTFSDANVSATTADFSANISWGDGTTSNGTVSGSTGGPFTTSGTHTYADEGSYAISVIVTDDGGNYATLNGTASVSDAAMTPGSAQTISSAEGAAFSSAVGSFSDANSGATTADFTAPINWGDGSSSAGTVSGAAGGPFTVSGSHTYAEEGSYATSVIVTDDGSSTATLKGTASVADAALSSNGAMPSSTVQSYSGPTATFTDQSSTGTPSDFSAMISWGDGTTSPGTITGGPGTAHYSVSGSHTYSSTGFFTVTTVINDVGGSSTTASGQVLVFAFAPGGGSFAIGDLESANGKTVTFWGAQWSKANPTSTGSKAARFKGFAPAPASPSCGSTWSAGSGNSASPPSGPLPDFMGVIVTSSYGQTGSTTSGNTVHIIIVKTNAGYQPDPGHAGTGTVIQQAC